MFDIDGQQPVTSQLPAYQLGPASCSFTLVTAMSIYTDASPNWVAYPDSDLVYNSEDQSLTFQTTTTSLVGTTVTLYLSAQTSDSLGTYIAPFTVSI